MLSTFKFHAFWSQSKRGLGTPCPLPVAPPPVVVTVQLEAYLDARIKALNESKAGQFPHSLLGYDDVLRRNVKVHDSLGRVQVVQRLRYLQEDKRR